MTTLNTPYSQQQRRRPARNNEMPLLAVWTVNNASQPVCLPAPQQAGRPVRHRRVILPEARVSRRGLMPMRCCSCPFGASFRRERALPPRLSVELERKVAQGRRAICLPPLHTPCRPSARPSCHPTPLYFFLRSSRLWGGWGGRRKRLSGISFSLRLRLFIRGPSYSQCGSTRN